MPKLTRSYIMSLKPGPELDGLVLTQVFGRTMSMVLSKPNYSTSMDAAFEIVESLHEKYFTLVHVPEGCTYSACFDGREVVICDTAPEAICKASLLCLLESK